MVGRIRPNPSKRSVNMQTVLTQKQPSLVSSLNTFDWLSIVKNTLLNRKVKLVAASLVRSLFILTVSV